MRVLHVYKDYAPVRGGIENHIKTLAEAQAARGHTVSVLVTSRDRASHVDSIKGVRVIYAARVATIASTPLSLALVSCLRRESADVVHLHFPYPWGEVANLIRGGVSRTVLTYHSDIVRQKFLGAIYAPLLQAVLAKTDTIIATSSNYVATSPVLARWRQKCVVIPLAIEARRFAEVDDAAAMALRRRLLAGHDTAPLALFVGVLREYKGLSYLLQAMVQVADLRLIVAGTGPMEEVWKEQARSLGLHPRVHFAGAVSDAEIAHYYAASDVVVLPSSQRSEAFGTVQLEAMAAGKPVVCTQLGTGTDFVNLNGITGYVVRARDAGALAEALRRLIGDAELRWRMGAAGRKRVVVEFNVADMTERVLSVYQNVLESA